MRRREFITLTAVVASDRRAAVPLREANKKMFQLSTPMDGHA